MTGARILRGLIRQWKSDIDGLRRMAKRSGKAEEWAEALDASVAADTMERVVQDAERALTAALSGDA